MRSRRGESNEPNYAVLAQAVIDLVAQSPDPNAVVLELIRRLDLTVIVSVSGGKDSFAMLAWLVEQVGPARVLAHLQVIPLAWPDELPYAQTVCQQLGVRLVAQQIIYEAVPGTAHGVRRREIRDITDPAQVVPWGQEGAIACLTDFFDRRGWPPAARARWCTGKFKTSLLDCFARPQGEVPQPAAPAKESPLSSLPRDSMHDTGLIIADPSDLARWRGWPPSNAQRFCTSYFKRECLTAYVTSRRAAWGPWVIVALGERAGESPSRAQKPVLGFRGKPRQSYAFLNWLPIKGMRRIDTFRTLREWGIPFHPAYAAQGMTAHECLDVDAEGGPRVSCRACIFASEPQVCAQMEDLANLPVLVRLAAVEQHTGRTWWYPGRKSAQELLHEILDRHEEHFLVAAAAPLALGAAEEG